MNILDTTGSLNARAKESIAAKLLEKYYGKYDKYPSEVEGIIIRPLNIDSYEADLVVKGQEIMTLRFLGKLLRSKSIKLPKRDLDENNIR